MEKVLPQLCLRITFPRHVFFQNLLMGAEQGRLEGSTCTIPSDDVMQKSLTLVIAERSNIAAPRVILCKFSSFLK